MIKEQRKRKRRWKKVAIAFLIIILFLLIAFIVVIKVFTVKKVKVEGNLLYNQDVIEEAVLNDKYSWNSLYVFLKYRFVDTEPIPFVDTMEITLENPTTLHIEVYEKGMMGYFYISAIDENAYFDKDGIVVETSSEVISGVPKVEGIACEEVVLYEKLPIEKNDLKEILTLTQALKREDLVPEAIVYGQDNSPILTYENIRIELGDTKLLTQKVERISKIMPSIDGMSGVLHLENWTEDTTNIVFEKNE